MMFKEEEEEVKTRKGKVNEGRNERDNKERNRSV